MKSPKLYILLTILLLLSGCDCNCYLVPIPHVDASNYTTTTSKVTVFADGCSNADGNVNTDGMPLGSCDGVGEYNNRGRWVAVPNIISVPGSQLQVSVYGSVYYCSSGYDNKNPSPQMVVKPGAGIQKLFNDNLSMSVTPGQILVLSVVEPAADNGVAIGANPSSLVNLPVCGANDYNQFADGDCRAKQGYGLTIYVDNKEIVTLDNMAKSDSYYPIANARYPDLYKTYLPSSYPNGNSISLDDYYSNVYTAYYATLDGTGPGKYVFTVPNDVKGELSFSIAQASGNSGAGQYTLNVLTVPQACFVSESQAAGQPGNRGALQVLISEANPNDVDDVLAVFDAYDNDLSSYYPELVNYLNSKAGVTISSNAEILNNLEVSSTPGLTPMILTEPGYTGTTNYAGQVWFKVRDDYYHDNVGQYNVSVEMNTKKGGNQVSSFMQSIIDPVTKALNGAVQIIYHNFIEDNRFLNIIKMCLILYVMVYGAEFMLGLTSVSSYDARGRIFKIGIVVELFEPDHWDFFNENFFKLFTDGSNYLVVAITGDGSTYKTGIFGFIDDVFNVFFAEDTWKRIAALIPSVIGVVYFFVFIWVMIIYLMVLVKLILSYLLIMMAVALLLSLAPLFILMILFDRTRKFFQNWVKYMVDYALQPVIMFTVLYVTNQIFMTLWQSATDFDICYGGVWDLVFDVERWTYGVIPSFSMGCIWGLKVVGGLDPYGMMMKLVALILFLMAMRSIINHVPEITAHLTGATAAAGNIDDVSAHLMDSAAGVINKGANMARGALGDETLQKDGDIQDKLKSAAKVRSGGFK